MTSPRDNDVLVGYVPLTDEDISVLRFRWCMGRDVRCNEAWLDDEADADRMSRWRRDRMDGSLLTPAMSAEEDRQEYEQS